MEWLMYILAGLVLYLIWKHTIFDFFNNDSDRSNCEERKSHQQYLDRVNRECKINVSYYPECYHCKHVAIEYDEVRIAGQRGTLKGRMKLFCKQNKCASKCDAYEKGE